MKAATVLGAAGGLQVGEVFFASCRSCGWYVSKPLEAQASAAASTHAALHRARATR